jgi:hypothetical protein
MICAAIESGYMFSGEQVECVRMEQVKSADRKIHFGWLWSMQHTIGENTQVFWVSPSHNIVYHYLDEISFESTVCTQSEENESEDEIMPFEEEKDSELIREIVEILEAAPEEEECGDERTVHSPSEEVIKNSSPPILSPSPVRAVDRRVAELRLSASPPPPLIPSPSETKKVEKAERVRIHQRTRAFRFYRPPPKRGSFQNRGKRHARREKIALCNSN